MLPMLEDYLALLKSLHHKISLLIEGLPPAALDWSPGPDMNSLGVLAAHTAGAERYWMGDVVGRDPSGRDRDAEFCTRGLNADTLLAHLDVALSHTCGVLQGLTLLDIEARRVSPRDGNEVAVAWALAHTLEHTALHLGHIQITRQLWDQQPSSPFDYYAYPGLMTDPKEYAGLLDGLPTDIAALCQVVQGLLLHIFWAERYGEPLSDERKQEVELRYVSRMLARIRELDDRPLTEVRPLDKRLVGNCRNFSVLLCAILRHQGVPARARCGFGAYFLPNHYEDHWACEYWKADEQRWVMVDAQLDQLQRQALNIQFDPLDVPRDQFLTGGRAWQVCHAGQADPDQFGISDMHGMWFIRGDLGRDFLALNKIEILPWDGWGVLYKDEAQVTEDDRKFLDHIAALTLAGDEAFPRVRSTYEDARLCMPSDWRPRTLVELRQS